MPGPRDLRFRPPRVAPPAELVWLLGIGLGPAWQEPPPGGRPEAMAELAVRFDLGPRIVARHGSDRLRRSLGEQADPLVCAHRRAVAVALACERVAAEIATLAAEAATPIIFLKGYALHRLVEAPPGRRPFADLDLLAPAEGAPRLRDRMAEAGYQILPVPANEQHLSPALSPAGAPVDLHFRLRSVSLGRGWATAEELLAAGLCRPVDALPGSASVPSPRLLAAHLVAHGIEQHGFRPADYPLLRLLADLADLAPAGQRRPEPLNLEWIHSSVSPREAEATLRLAEILAGGDLPEPARDPDADLLLRHIVAGALDPGYRATLSLDHTAGRFRTALKEGHLMAYAARKLRPAGDGEGQRPVWRGAGTALLRPLRAGLRYARSAIGRIVRSS